LIVVSSLDVLRQGDSARSGIQRARSGRDAALHPVLDLQARAGNAAVAQLVQRGRVVQRQVTTTIGTPKRGAVDITQIATGEIEKIVTELEAAAVTPRVTEQIELAKNYVVKRKAALAAIDVFGGASTPPESPHYKDILAADVVSHLKTTIDQPHLINQGQLAWCGPNTVLMVIARNDPVGYARFVTELYTTGRGKLGGLDVQAGTGVKTAWTAGQQIKGADWIALGSLRDAGNWFFSATEKTIGFATFPHDITGWLGTYGVARDKIVQKGGWIAQTDAGDLGEANAKFGEGWNILLWVHMFTLHEGGEPENITKFDIQRTHWVVMNGPFSHNPGSKRWSCPVNTWGGKGGNDIDVAEDRVSSSVFGFIAVDMNAQVRKPHV